MAMTFWLPQAEAALAQVERRGMNYAALPTEVLALLQQETSEQFCGGTAPKRREKGIL